MLKDTNLLILGSIMVLSLCGCQTAGPKTTTGAVGGGLLGAAVGGIVGHQSGHGLEGAAIGAVGGALAGGLVGNQMDKQALADNPNHIPLTKIAEMASQGLPDAVIIDEIQRTKSRYNLNSELITYLKENKVSDRVVDYMLSTTK
ncbi:MAG: glycine zipper 2TM domain-containing protein [Candidatus Omnitrophica bacterium]|jgi:uncharacterized protein YcfJ|nr:glycine zipper 2TM domain-containing protein [Candidatus Omnitrophota bacterium]